MINCKSNICQAESLGPPPGRWEILLLSSPGKPDPFISICKLMQFQSQLKSSDKETGITIINHKLNASGFIIWWIN